MKPTILLLMLMCSVLCKGQKINAGHYKYVERVNKYEDAQTITYRDKKWKLKTDTIYYSKQGSNISIEFAKVVNIYSTKIKRPK